MVIVDCVPYFQESSLLELRLSELDPLVDLFVIVEGDRTHKGELKPSHLIPIKDRFARWQHKMIHVIAPLPSGDGPTWIWRREIAQRNAIAGVLAQLQLAPDDMILISDCDEIPSRSFVAMLPSLEPDHVAIAIQDLHYYTFNHCAGNVWNGTRATQYANVQALGCDGVRYVGTERGGFPRVIAMRNAGWHLSYFGGPQAIATKIDSFLHQELNHANHRDPETIAARIQTGADVYGRPWQTFTIGVPESLPSAVAEQPMQWVAHFHPDYAPLFHEDWTQPVHSTSLSFLAHRSPPEGACLEIGCWEGVSTIAIAHGLGAHRELSAIDTWAGNIDEGADHPSVLAATTRDVYAQFLANMGAFHCGNVQPVRADWRDLELPAAIAFCHLDAAHDEQSVSDQLSAIIPRMVPGGVLCGDDFYAPGVQAAVVRHIPDAQTNGRIWWWFAPQAIDLSTTTEVLYGQ